MIISKKVLHTKKKVPSGAFFRSSQKNYGVSSTNFTSYVAKLQ